MQKFGWPKNKPKPAQVSPMTEQKPMPPQTQMPIQTQQAPKPNVQPSAQMPIQTQQTPKPNVQPSNQMPVQTQQAPKPNVQPSAQMPMQTQQTPKPNVQPSNQMPMQTQQAPKPNMMPNMQPSNQMPMQTQQAPKPNMMPNVQPSNQMPMQTQQAPSPNMMPNMQPLNQMPMQTQQAPSPNMMPNMQPSNQMPIMQTLPTKKPTPQPHINMPVQQSPMHTANTQQAGYNAPNHDKYKSGCCNMPEYDPMAYENQMAEQYGMNYEMPQQMMDMYENKPFHHSGKGHQPSLSEALELIREAVEGEAEDRMFYDYLIRHAPSGKDREIIRGIRDNEINHAKMFRRMYYEHTGENIRPASNANFTSPGTYCEGLIKALMGELNAVKKYRNILFAMRERRHINMLTEIITDEIRHANLYNFLIHNNDCKY